MIAAAPRKLFYALWARPGLGSALVHAFGLAIRLGFMFALLTTAGSALLGRYGLLTSIQLVVIYLAGFEFHSFTTRRYAHRPGARALQWALACHRRMLMISTPLAVTISAIIAYIFGVGLTAGDMVLFCVAVAASTVTQEVVRFIVLTTNPIYSVLIVALRTAFWQPFALLPLFLLHTNSLHPILIIWAIAEVAGMAWGLWLLRRALSLRVRPAWSYLAHGMWIARRFYLTASASVIQGNLERFVLQSFLGPDAVGIYSFFQNLANTLPALVQAAVMNVWLPQLLNHFGRARPERFDMLRGVVKRALAVSFGLAAVVAGGAVGLSLVLGRASYIQYSWVLFVLLVAQILQLSTQPLYLALYGARRDQAIMWLSLALLFVSLLLAIALVSTLGIAGAALSQLAGGGATLACRAAMFRLFVRRGLV